MSLELLVKMMKKVICLAQFELSCLCFGFYSYAPRKFTPVVQTCWIVTVTILIGLSCLSPTGPHCVRGLSTLYHTSRLGQHSLQESHHTGGFQVHKSPPNIHIAVDEIP